MKKPVKQWTAEITNDQERDFALYIELLEDDEAKARVERAESGALCLKIYPGEQAVLIPADWLQRLLLDAEKQL